MLVGLALTLAGSATGAVAGGSQSTRPHVVRPGDTLWSIAEWSSAGEDPRPIVDAIVRLNGIDADHLVPGQRLLVPVED